MVAKFVRSNASDPSLIYRFVRSNESYLSLTYCFVPPRGFIPIAIGTQLLYYQPACRRQEFVIRLQTCIPQKQGFFSNNPDSISSSYLRRDCKSRHLARPYICRISLLLSISAGTRLILSSLSQNFTLQLNDGKTGKTETEFKTGR